MAGHNSNKPTGVYFDQKKGRYRVHFQLSSNGTRIRRSKLLPKDTGAEEAQAIAESMRAGALREIVGIEPRHGWQLAVERALNNKGSWIHEIYRRARERARKKKREFSLSLDDLKQLLLRSMGKCEVTGIIFSDRVIGGARMRPLTPSLDRVDAAVGYRLENCRIVCAAVNIAMFDWGEEMFKNLAIGYLINQVIAPHATLFHIQKSAHHLPQDKPHKIV